MDKYIQLMTNTIKNTTVPKIFKLSGPQKISLKDRCSFSVPAGPKYGCPGATKACAGCYAQKGRHLWSPVQKAFAENWKLLKRYEQYKQSDRAAQSILQKMRNDLDIFRIYESGDFHSQWVIDVWSRVIKERKDVSFWAYTRSFNLDFTKLTRNFNFSLWASTDNYNLQNAKQFVRKSGVKHAYGPWEHNVELPKNSFICPPTNKKMELAGACEKCKLCVIKRKTNKNVVFLRH